MSSFNGRMAQQHRVQVPGLDHPVALVHEPFRLFGFAVLTATLIGLCVLLSVPLLPALTWGVALAIIALPMHRWVSRHVEWPGLAAALSSAFVVAVVVVPGLIIAYQLAHEAGQAAETLAVRAENGELRQKMNEIPGVSALTTWMERVNVDLEAELRKILNSFMPDFFGLAGDSVSVAIQLLAALFVLFYVFRDRHLLLRGLRELMPLSQAESERVFKSAADSVHANLYATMITSLVDATGGGLMFWMLGLPSPILWTVVMFTLSLLPVVGAALVWVPAAAYLLFTDHWLAAAALMGWGLLSFLIVDNVVYVRLAGGRMRMHPVPALVAFLGGLAVFGVSGMILGPCILAITVAVLDVWKQRASNSVCSGGTVTDRVTA